MAKPTPQPFTCRPGRHVWSGDRDKREIFCQLCGVLKQDVVREASGNLARETTAHLPDSDPRKVYWR